MNKTILPIGKTPMVQIEYKYKGKIKYFYAKLEYYNLTGSIKDRSAYYMLQKAIERGHLKPKQPIVETTSGNFGLGLAAIGTILGHPVHIFMPAFATEERKQLLKLYGAKLHLNYDEHDAFNIAMDNSHKFALETGAFETLQFENMDNVFAHYNTTGVEIVNEVGNSIGGFIAGIGSGGTFSGISKRIKEFNNKIKTWCVEPNNMPILSGGQLSGHSKISGIADDFIPSIVDTSLIDGVFGVEDDDAINMCRKIGQQIGLGIGISSGAYAIGAILLNEQLDKPVVTLFADDNKKYLSTELTDDNISFDNPNFISNQVEFLNVKTINNISEIRSH